MATHWGLHISASLRCNVRMIVHVEFHLLKLPLNVPIHLSVTVYTTRAALHGSQHRISASIHEATGAEGFSSALSLTVTPDLVPNHMHGDVRVINGLHWVRLLAVHGELSALALLEVAAGLQCCEFCRRERV